MPDELRFTATRSSGAVSAILRRPAGAHSLLVLGHGAGAGMHHAFLETMSEALVGRGLATFRYQFPYMEQGRRRPDPPDVLTGTVRAAVAAAAAAAPGLTLLAGGKSMGGRMTSVAAAREALPGVRGLIFFGFPLHPAARPDTARGDHLAEVGVPMLFLQGTRDKLADLDLLRPICRRLGERATLHVVDGGDHSFHVLRRSGRTAAQVLDELADAASGWARRLAAAGGSAEEAAGAEGPALVDPADGGVS